MSKIVRGCALSLAAIVLIGRPAALRAEDVEALIARHIEARGGQEKLKAITTLKTTLTLVTPFSEITMVVQRKRPALHRVDQSLPDGLSAARGVNAAGAWERNPKGEVRVRPPEWFAEMRDLDADFDGLLVDYQSKGHRVEYGGTEKVGARQAHKITVTLASGGVRHVFLDTETFLEIRQKGTLTLGPDRRTNVELSFGDYREVAGVKFPFAIDDERDGPGQTYAIYVQKIEPNVPIEDSVFDTPAAVK